MVEGRGLTLAIAARIFVPFAAGYFLSYLYRNVNAVIAADLLSALRLEAAALGLLTSAYFLTFAAFQLPLGVLLDRYGPRRVESVLLLVAAAGAALFAVADALPALVVGRALIGLGVSACLMGSFKAFVLWFPRAKLPLANGCILAAGGLGALAATTPVEWALGRTDWRGVFALLSGLTVVVAAVLWLVVPRRAEERDSPRTSWGEQLSGLAGVFRHRLFWRVAPVTALTQGSFLALQGLWAGPWLADVANLDRGAVARHLFLIAVTLVAGFLGAGAVADRLGRYGVSSLTVAVVGMLISILVQGAIALEAPGPSAVWWGLFGLVGTTGILCFAHLSQSFAPALAGRVNTALNVLVFLTAFAAQWGIGAVIGLWPGEEAGTYLPEGYRAGFLMAVVLQAAAFGWLVVAGRRARA